jgi:hypothetical protein
MSSLARALLSGEVVGVDATMGWSGKALMMKDALVDPMPSPLPPETRKNAGTIPYGGGCRIEHSTGSETPQALTMIQTEIGHDQINGTGRTLEFYGGRDGFSHLQWEAWLLAQLDQRNSDFSEGMFFGHNLPKRQRLRILIMSTLRELVGSLNRSTSWPLSSCERSAWNTRSANVVPQACLGHRQRK